MKATFLKEDAMKLISDSDVWKGFLFKAGATIYREDCDDRVRSPLFPCSKMRDCAIDQFVMTDVWNEVAGPVFTKIAGQVSLSMAESDVSVVGWVLSYQGWYNHANPNVRKFWHEALRTACAAKKFNGGRGLQISYGGLSYSNTWKKDNFRTGSGYETIHGKDEQLLLYTDYMYQALY